MHYFIISVFQWPPRHPPKTCWACASPGSLAAQRSLSRGKGRSLSGGKGLSAVVTVIVSFIRSNRVSDLLVFCEHVECSG